MRGATGGRLPSWIIGLAVAIVIALGSVLAYTKELPWSGGHEISATFASAQGVRPSSPVRVAGIQVGEVTKVDQLADGDPNEGVVVTMELSDNAPTIRDDAIFKLRPRLFLEGNYFVDMHAGSPSAPEVGEGHTFPVNQTSYSAQIDELFTTLQGDVRANLQVFLDQFGNGLMRYGGADGFRELHRSSPDAYRFTSEVNQAFLGREPGDLGGTIRGLGKVLRGLSRSESALQGFVTNLRTVTGSFAAEEQALARSIELLPGFMAAGEPAFTELNGALPSLRAFAREILPGVRSSPETLRVATPFLAQMSELMSPDELGGLASDLRPTIPLLANLNRANLDFLEQQRFLSSCFNEVVIPWSNSTVEPVDPLNVYPHEPGGRVFEESAYGLTGTATESRSGDANGQHLRVMAGGGPNLVRIPGSADGFTQDAFGLTEFPILGAMPRIDDSTKTPYRPDTPCERQEPPNLEAGVGQPPTQETLPASAFTLSGPGSERLAEIADLLDGIGAEVGGLRDQGEMAEARRLINSGQRALDQLGITDVDLEAQLGGER